MASDDSCCKLVVGNLPDSMADDGLLVTLIFESSSDCPDGGDVIDIEMHPDRRNAVVTFADPEVVSRLLICKTVAYKGALLTMQSFKEELVGDKDCSGNDDDENDNDSSDSDIDITGVSCKNYDRKVENENSFEVKSNMNASESNVAGNADSSADERDSQKDEGTSDVSDDEKAVGDHVPLDAVEPAKDVSSDEFCSLGEDDVSSNTEHAESETKLTEALAESSIEFPISQINLSNSNENSGNFSETEAKDLFEDQKNRNMPDHFQTSSEDKDKTLLQVEKLEDLTDTSKVMGKDINMPPTEMHKDEVKLSREKVKLLKILSDAKLLGESATESVTSFDADHGKVILAGSKEEIMNAKLAMLEKASTMSNFRVEMRKETSELLFTVRGAQWLEKEFQQHQIHAVVYQKDYSIEMVAADDISYENATKILQEILAAKVIPFQNDHLEYLQSDIWKKSMEEFSAKEIIHISVDFNSSEITVEGCADSVRLLYENISALLKANSKVTKSIKLRKGSLRLLKEHRNADGITVRDALKHLGDWAVEIEYKEAGIELRGTREAVEETSRVIDDKYVSSIQHVQYEVSMAGVTVDSFTAKNSFGEEIIEALERKHECVIEVRERNSSNVNDAKDSTDMLPDGKSVDASEAVGILDNVKAAVNYIVPILSGLASGWDATPDPVLPTNIDVPKIASNITIQTGSLVDFQADVLVNPIAHTTRQLVKAGAVAKSFYKKGKDVLQQEFEQVGSPRDFGGAISVTSNAAGVFPCKKIYHVAIRHFRDNQSYELLRKMIEGCLKKAEGENMTSVAFPTVGCGKLGYNTKDVVRCFNEAACNSTLQVYIIGYEQATCDAFASYLTQPILNKPQETVQKKLEVTQPKPAPLTAAQVNAVPSSPSKSSASSLVRKAIVFHIVAFSKEAAEKSRERLAKKLSECLTDVKIEKELIANLSDDMISMIRKLPCASEIDLQIDKRNKTIQLRGHYVSVRKTNAAISKLLAEEEKNWNDLQYIKKSKGVAAYLSKLATTEDLQLPKYWAHYKRYDQHDTGSIETQLQSGTEVYKAVEAMVMGTWEAGKVGQGNDAANLSHSNIKIEKISVVENLNQFHSYKSQLKNLSYRAARNLFKPVTSLQGEAEISTKSLPGVNYLYDGLVSEVNEYYLLHGTSQYKTIAKAGIDFRFSGDRVLFGKGAYFAEKSIKADQYADPKDHRKPNGEKLYMFVARVLLGEPHLCQKPYAYKKAPCSEASCQSESCSSSHLPCDSVIGTHRNSTAGTARLLFREFIIYHMDQCYPEFLVEYVRQ